MYLGFAVGLRRQPRTYPTPICPRKMEFSSVLGTGLPDPPDCRRRRRRRIETRISMTRKVDVVVGGRRVHHRRYHRRADWTVALAGKTKAAAVTARVWEEAETENEISKGFH